MKLKYFDQQIRPICRKGFIHSDVNRIHKRTPFFKLTVRGRRAHDVEQWQNNGIAHIKLVCRDDGCSMPNNAEYLLVVANEVDTSGNWLPHHTLSIADQKELVFTLRQIANTTGTVFIEASDRFAEVALKMNFPLISGQWRLV